MKLLTFDELREEIDRLHKSGKRIEASEGVVRAYQPTSPSGKRGALAFAAVLHMDTGRWFTHTGVVTKGTPPSSKTG